MIDETSGPVVLMVDDREVNLLVLERVLDELDVGVIKATSGDQALALMLDHDFAVVLMDVQMPGMDGYETVDLMRRNRRTRNLPVIFVSANGTDEQAPTAYGVDIGAVDFVGKPVNPEILRSKVRVFAELYQLRRDLEASNRRIGELMEALAAQSMDERRADGATVAQ